MLWRKEKKTFFDNSLGRSTGFTLVEVLIAMVTGLIALGSIYSVYISQMKAHGSQRAHLALQQNLRSAMVILEQEIRMAGFDPEDSNQFGITDVRRFDLVANAPNPDGSPALFYTIHADEDGLLSPRNHYRNNEHCNFRIRQEETSGRQYLAWDFGQGRQIMAEDIEAIGFAYGVDVNRDGRLDHWGNGANLIWAVDSDNDNRLDTHIDPTDDGLVDAGDDRDQDGRITPMDGGVLNPPIAVGSIKAVRVWLLAKSTRPVKDHVDQGVYVVGDKIIKPNGDGFVRRLLVTTIDGRNL